MGALGWETILVFLPSWQVAAQIGWSVVAFCVCVSIHFEGLVALRSQRHDRFHFPMFMYGSTAVLSNLASVRLRVDGILLKPKNHLS